MCTLQKSIIVATYFERKNALKPFFNGKFLLRTVTNAPQKVTEKYQGVMVVASHFDRKKPYYNPSYFLLSFLAVFPPGGPLSKEDLTINYGILGKESRHKKLPASNRLSSS